MAKQESVNTKQKLISAAKKLFAQKGFKETTIKDLVCEAGVNASLVSYHFGGKEGLYKACIGQAAYERLKVTEKILKPPKSEEEFKLRLGLYIQDMLEFYVEEPELTSIIHREFEMNTPALKDVFEDTFLKTFLILKDYIEKAQGQGVVSTHRDSKIVTSMFFAYLTHLARMDHLTKEYFQLSIRDKTYQDQVSEQMLEIFWNGIKSGGNKI